MCMWRKLTWTLTSAPPQPSDVTYDVHVTDKKGVFSKTVKTLAQFPPPLAKTWCRSALALLVQALAKQSLNTVRSSGLPSHESDTHSSPCQGRHGGGMRNFGWFEHWTIISGKSPRKVLGLQEKNLLIHVEALWSEKRYPAVGQSLA